MNTKSPYPTTDRERLIEDYRKAQEECCAAERVVNETLQDYYAHRAGLRTARERLRATTRMLRKLACSQPDAVLKEHETYECERCGSQLSTDEVVWLELSSKTGVYHPEGNTCISEEDSQGLFPFSDSCAAICERGGFTS